MKSTPSEFIDITKEAIIIDDPLVFATDLENRGLLNEDALSKMRDFRKDIITKILNSDSHKLTFYKR